MTRRTLRRGFGAAAAVLALALAGRAQPAPAPTSDVYPYGHSRTYRALLDELRGLRLVRPDSTSEADLAQAGAGLGRFVVDETVSRAGGVFYDAFYRFWKPPADARFVSVVLSEQPIPGQATLVSVRLDGELVYQARLTPREDAAEEVAREAVLATLRRLVQG